MTVFYFSAASQSILKRIAAFLLCVCSLTAHAAITCSITPPSAVNFAHVSNSNNTTPANVQQGAVSAICTRTSSGDPTSLDLGVSDGLYASGLTNNVQLNSSRINYDFYSNSDCTAQWSNANTRKITVTISSQTLNTPVTSTFNYRACKPAAQNVSSSPSGVYTDRVDLTLSAGGSNVATSSIDVNLYAPAFCSIGSGPGTLSFNYQAFSTRAVFAGTSFKADCTNYLPYTMTLDTLSGVVGGLRYTLALSLAAAGNASNIGLGILSTTGNATGSATHYINGSMAAEQAGQTGPITPQVHTLTITY